MKPIEHLSSILQLINGPVSRNALQAKRKEIQGKLKNARAAPPSLVAKSQTAETSADCNLASEEPIQALLLELLSKTHLAALKKDYTDGDPACIRIGQRVADDAALVVVTRLNLLPLLYTKLHSWGFSKFASINLLSVPSGPDATDEKVIATCRRGNTKLPPLSDWPSEPDLLKLAEHFVSDIHGRKVHLFAEKPRSGWESLIGEANWAVA